MPAACQLQAKPAWGSAWGARAVHRCRGQGLGVGLESAAIKTLKTGILVLSMQDEEAHQWVRAPGVRGRCSGPGGPGSWCWAGRSGSGAARTPRAPWSPAPAAPALGTLRQGGTQQVRSLTASSQGRSSRRQMSQPGWAARIRRSLHPACVLASSSRGSCAEHAGSDTSAVPAASDQGCWLHPVARGCSCAGPLTASCSGNHTRLVRQLGDAQLLLLCGPPLTGFLLGPLGALCWAGHGMRPGSVWRWRWLRPPSWPSTLSACCT